MSTEHQNARRLVVFTLGAEQYAVPISQVQEIIRYTKLRSIVSSDPWVRGVLSLRGKIVPVYDLSARLRIDSAVSNQLSIVILDTGTQIVGVIVEAVDEVLTIGDDQIDKAPHADGTLIESIAKIENRLIVLLNPEAIVTDNKLAA
jgi:purine-binding chemotaxis protein CheW